MNSARGESSVKIGQLEFVACATLGALASVEGRLGKPLGFIISDDLAKGSYQAALAILEECCADPDARLKIRDQIAGPVDLADAAVKILTAAGLLGGATSSRTAEPPKA